MSTNVVNFDLTKPLPINSKLQMKKVRRHGTYYIINWSNADREAVINVLIERFV